MGCHYFQSGDGHISGHISLCNIYKYKNRTFEFHSYMGFVPVTKKSFKVLKTIPKGFWDIAHEFAQLPDKEKETYLIYG